MGPRISVSYCCQVTSCTGSLGVTIIIVCTGVKFKSCFNVVENHTNTFLLLTIQKKSIIWPIYDHDDVPFRSYWRKDQMLNFGSTGVKRVNMMRFCWQWSQNVHQVNTMNNHMWNASLLWLRSKIGQPMGTLTFSLHNHVTVTCYT